MKKLLFIILIVLVVVIAGVIIFIPTGRERIFRTSQAVVEIATIPAGIEHSPEELVPARAALFLRIYGIKDGWDKFTGGEFFRGLIESQLWKEERIEENLSLFREEFAERNGFEITRSRIMDLVGEDIALAVLPAQIYTPDAVLLLSRVGLKARLIEIMARWGDGLQDEEDRMLQEEEYQGEKIFLFQPTDSSPFFGAYAFIGDYLAISISPLPVGSVIRGVIDRYQGKKTAGRLKNSPDFINAGREVFFPSESFLEWYLQPNLLRQIIDGDFASCRKYPALYWGEEILLNFPGVESISGRIGYTDGIRFRLAMKSQEKFIDSIGDSSGEFLEYIPAPALTFARSEFGPSLTWKKIANIITDLARQGYSRPLVGLREWEREAGVNVSDDILPILGEEWAIMLNGGEEDEFIPIPTIAIILPISDREEAGRIMGRIATRAARVYNWTLARERHGDCEIIFADGVSGGKLDLSAAIMLFTNPAYALVENKLIISNSSGLLKNIIDTGNGTKPGIENDPDFQKVAAVVGTSRNNFIYLNTGETIESLINIGKWYLPIQELSDEKPWLPEEVFLKKIVPILELSSIVQSAGITINFKKSVVKGEGFLYIK